MSDWRKTLRDSVAAENEAKQVKVRAVEASEERQKQNKQRAIDALRQGVLPALDEIRTELNLVGRTVEIVDRSDPTTSSPEVRAKIARPDRAAFEIVFKCDPQPDAIRVSIRSGWGEGSINSDVPNGLDAFTKQAVIDEVVSRYGASLSEG